MWRVLATHSFRQFPLHFPSRASRCAITFQLKPKTSWPKVTPRYVASLAQKELTNVTALGRIRTCNLRITYMTWSLGLFIYTHTRKHTYIHKFHACMHTYIHMYKHTYTCAFLIQICKWLMGIVFGYSCLLWYDTVQFGSHRRFGKSMLPHSSGYKMG